MSTTHTGPEFKNMTGGWKGRWSCLARFSPASLLTLAAGGSEYGSVSSHHISIHLKTSLLFVREGLVYTHWGHSSTSYSQMNHCCWVMLNYFAATPSQISPQQPAGALVPAQLWKPVVFSEWKLANKPCFCHTFFVFFRNLNGGNYDALPYCITYLPISLAPSSPSCVVLGFCPFHLVFRALTFCRVPLSKVQRQLAFQVVSEASHFALRVAEQN